MTPVDLPLRLIPKRKTHPLKALAVLLACLLVSLGIRFLTYGLQLGQGLVSTIFPALMLITVYAGMGWGLAAVGIALGFIAVVIAHNVGAQVTTEALLGVFVFALSALVTVWLAGWLRKVLIRLDETRRDRDRVLAERSESELRFRSLADSAAALMWVAGPDSRREFVNRAYADFVGVPPEEARQFDWRTRLHPDDYDRVVAEWSRFEAANQPFVLEARYKRADGEYRWLRSISRPKTGLNGEARGGFVGLAVDVTDAKRVEEDLKNINDILAERIEAAVKERDAAQAALMQSQKLEALGQLTGGVAHDFNNLLTVVIGALDIILLNPTDAVRRAKLGEAALAAARRGERLTQQLLAFSRRQPLKPEVLAIDALLAESEPLLRRAVGEGFDLSFDLRAGKNTFALIDGGQFEAAVLNLLLNARDATADTGKIVVASEIGRQAEGELAAGGYIKVTISDDGAGMSPETIARCFEPFYTTKPVGKGTGLGLSQVYGFARQSGGDAKIVSEPGKGTAISLCLPVSQEARAEAPAAGRADKTPAGAWLKVLLVEDDADVGDLVEAMLRELGHTVVRAANVEQALHMAAEQRGLDLMLTDVIMPGGRTGVDLAREVSRQKPGLPIILSSGYTGATLAEADRAPWPLLRKPYTIEALKAVIDEALQKSAAPAA